MVLKIKNAVLITDKLEYGKNLYIDNGRILSLTSDELSFDEEIDAKGLYISSGFIDIHTHGAGGFDYSDGTVEDILNAAYSHAKYGATTIFPTSSSLSTEDTDNFVLNVKEAMKSNAPGRPYIAGSHLEGPYFAYSQRGAQNPDRIKAPVKSEYMNWVAMGEGTLKRISYAPELEGSAEMCKFLSENGVLSGFAHTDGIYEEIKPLIDLGCNIATHLYSGMNTVTRREMHRKLGAVETAFLEDSVITEVIADGVHLPVELLKLIYKIKGVDKICLVTDSIRGAGMDSGIIISGGLECYVEKDYVAYLTDKTSFAGSVASPARLVKTMYKSVGIPLCETIKMITENPAKIMKLENRGKLVSGYFADLVFFDDNINIERVMIEGKELT